MPRPGQPAEPAPPGAPPPEGGGAGRSGPAPGGDGPPGGVAGPDGPAGGELDEEAARAQLAALQEQIAAAPVEDLIANHAFGLFELAAVHLSRQPPKLPEARLAVDALGAIVEALGDRLGEHAPTLREGLAQIRLAYVQIASAAATADGEDPVARAGEPPAAPQSEAQSESQPEPPAG